MDYEQSKAEPCLYFGWTMSGLILWLTWVDDCCLLGDEDGVKAAKEQMKSKFNCDEIGELTEYVCCNIERTSNYLRFTHLFCYKVMRANLLWRKMDLCTLLWKQGRAW
jgi:hypothetical protein